MRWIALDWHLAYCSARPPWNVGPPSHSVDVVSSAIFTAQVLRGLVANAASTVWYQFFFNFVFAWSSFSGAHVRCTQERSISASKDPHKLCGPSTLQKGWN